MKSTQDMKKTVKASKDWLEKFLILWGYVVDQQYYISVDCAGQPV